MMVAAVISPTNQKAWLLTSSTRYYHHYIITSATLSCFPTAPFRSPTQFHSSTGTQYQCVLLFRTTATILFYFSLVRSLRNWYHFYWGRESESHLREGICSMEFTAVFDPVGGFHAKNAFQFTQNNFPRTPSYKENVVYTLQREGGWWLGFRNLFIQQICVSQSITPFSFDSLLIAVYCLLQRKVRK